MRILLLAFVLAAVGCGSDEPDVVVDGVDPPTSDGQLTPDETVQPGGELAPDADVTPEPDLEPGATLEPTPEEDPSDENL